MKSIDIERDQYYEANHNEREHRLERTILPSGPIRNRSKPISPTTTANEKLAVYKFDVKTAFLHAHLEETIAVTQPERFTDDSQRDRYGLPVGSCLVIQHPHEAPSFAPPQI